MPRGGALPVAGLLALSAAAALWAVRPFRDLPEVVPQEGGAAAGAGAAIAVVGLMLVAVAAAALVWAVRRDLDRAVRLVVHAAIAFGLLLLLVPLVLAVADRPAVPSGAGWAVAVAMAAGLAWLLRDGWGAQVAAALAAGGFGGMAAGVARLAILAVVAGALTLYDVWAVRRAAGPGRGGGRMADAADAADQAGAPLSVGSAEAGLSLGLGDLLVPAALLAASAAHGGLPPALGALGLGVGLALLARAVAQGGDAPGLPYLAGGSLGGIGLGLWLGPLAA